MNVHCNTYFDEEGLGSPEETTWAKDLPVYN